MKIIEGEKEILQSEKKVYGDGIVEECRTYRYLPDKKVLEREDRFINVKADGYLIKKNHIFFVTTTGENKFNIFTVEHGNVYYPEPAESLEELSEWIVSDFEDFNVLTFSNNLATSVKF